MLTARAQRRAASLCLSLVLFSITPSNIWTLQSQEGEEDSWQWARQLLSARGFNSLSCREDWVWRRGKGWGGVSWVGRNDGLAKRGEWRGLKRSGPSISCHGCLGELLQQKCWDNTRQTSLLPCSSNSCRTTTGEKFTWLPFRGGSKKPKNNQCHWTFVDRIIRERSAWCMLCFLELHRA